MSALLWSPLKLHTARPPSPPMRSRGLLLVLCALTFCAPLACGAGDDSEEVAPNTTHMSRNNDAPADMGSGTVPNDMIFNPDADADHTASEDMASDPAPPYSGDLADLGPLGACPTSIANTIRTAPVTEGDTPPTAARVFTVSWRVDLDAEALDAHSSWRERLHSLIHERVAPCLHDDAPNLVVFPEGVHLPALLIGPDTQEARAQPDTQSALASLAGALGGPLSYYTMRYPDASLTRRVLLAGADRVARTICDGFAQIADRYDLYISVTAAVPPLEEVDDPEVLGNIADPHAYEAERGWRATGNTYRSTQLLFGPDGAEIGRTSKLYPTRYELDQLELNGADWRALRPINTPWGRTGVLMSSTVYMPDVRARYEDLGAQVLLHPSATIGGWVPTDPNAPWPPAAEALGAWSAIQQSSRAQVAVAAPLTGAFFDLFFDSQAYVAAKLGVGASSGRFVGQRQALPAYPTIGEWVVEDPEDASGDLAQRRAQLAQTSAKLRPGSGDPLEGQTVEGVWGIDLLGEDEKDDDDRTPPASSPSAAIDGGALFTVTARGAIGARHLAITTQGLSATPSAKSVATLEQEGYDLIRPEVVLDDMGDLHIVAEAITHDTEINQDNPLYYARVAKDSGEVRHHGLLEMAGEWGHHPSIALAQGTLHLTWTKDTGHTRRIHYAQAPLKTPARKLEGADTEDPGASEHNPWKDVRAVPIEPLPTPPMQVGDTSVTLNQWGARIAASDDVIAVVWTDYRDWRWGIWCAWSTDAGLTWSDPRRIDDAEEMDQTYHAQPSITAVAPFTFAVAWTDASVAQRRATIATRTITVRPGGYPLTLGPTWRPTTQTGEARWAWEPALAKGPLGARVIWRELRGDGTQLGVADLDIEQERVIARPTPTPASERRDGEYGLELLTIPSSPDGAPTTIAIYERITPLPERASALMVRPLF